MGIFKSSKKEQREDIQEAVSQKAGVKGGYLKFVIPYFDVFDPRLTDCGVPVAVHGSAVYVVDDQDLFCSINGDGCTEEEFQQKMKNTLSKYIKGVVTNAPIEEQIPVVQLERKILEISELVRLKVSPQVENVLGIRIKSLDIATIIIDKDSTGYRELRSLTADLEKENLLAKHNASISSFNLQNSLQEDRLKVQSSLELDALKRKQELALGQQEDTQRIQLENQAETMRIQREEMQRAARLQTEQTFFDAHKVDIAAGLSGVEQPPQLPTDQQVEYYIGVDGKQAGPFRMEQLRNLASQGHITPKTYVWTLGMSDWAIAGNVPALSDLFAGAFPQTPPKLPSI